MFRLAIVSCLVSVVVCNASSLSQEDLVNRIVALEAKQAQTDIEVASLRHISASQESHIYHLTKKLDIETRQNHQIIKQFNSLKRTISSLTATLLHCDPSKSIRGNSATQTKGSKELIDDATEDAVRATDALNTPDAEQANTISDKDTQGKLRRQAPEGGVAFSVYLDHREVLHDTQTIKFNKVITNDGNGYNIHSGVFTCPKAGTYFLYFAIGQFGVGETDVTLLVNSIRVMEAYTEGFHSNQNTMGGNGVVIRLHQGDVVWIDGHSNVESSETWRSTSFSGFYLYP